MNFMGYEMTWITEFWACFKRISQAQLRRYFSLRNLERVVDTLIDDLSRAVGGAIPVTFFLRLAEAFQSVGWFDLYLEMIKILFVWFLIIRASIPKR